MKEKNLAVENVGSVCVCVCVCVWLAAGWEVGHLNSTQERPCLRGDLGGKSCRVRGPVCGYLGKNYFQAEGCQRERTQIRNGKENAET